MKHCGKHGKIMVAWGVLGVLVLGTLGALESPAEAALADTLAQATSVQYVFDHPKPGQTPSRRVVVTIAGSGPGGSVLIEKWDGSNWLTEDGPTGELTDVALDATILAKRAQADASNATELAAQLLTDSAAVVRTGLTNAGAPTPSQAQLEAAMNPGTGGQTVFNLVRKSP